VKPQLHEYVPFPLTDQDHPGKPCTGGCYCAATGSCRRARSARNHKAWIDLTEQRGRVGELFGEADAWIDLIAEELHRRRHEGLL